METIKLNIGLRFDHKTINEITQSLDPVRDFEAKYILDNEMYIPHLTLYQSLFPKKNVEDVKQALADIAGNTSSFKLRFNRLMNSRSSIWAGYEKPAQLLNLHEKVLEQIQPLRDGLVEDQFQKDHPVFLALPPQKQDMVEKWGHPYVAEAFDSHISLMKLIDRELVFVVLRRIPWNLMQIPVNKLAVYEGGIEGTCKEVLAEFDLA